MVRQLNGWGLSETLVNVLRTLGLTVIDALPSFIKSHPQCFQYVNQPTVQGVLKAISVNTTNIQTVARKLQENTSDEEKRQLRAFLSQERSLEAKEKELVRSLPLFETLDGSGNRASHFVSASRVQWAAPVESLPVRSTEILIDTTDDESKRLAQVVGVQQLKTTELLTRFVLPDVEKSRYSENEVDHLMLFVIERLPQYRTEDKNFEQYLKSLSFVSRSGDSLRVKPSELFDPSVKTLADIFLDEQDLFPSVAFRDDTILGELRKLGMKKESNITANDILRSVNQIASISDNTNKANTKSEAILEFLNRNPSKLQDCVSSGVSLREAICSIRWVARTKAKPSYYPDNLPLYSAGTSPFEGPRDMVASTKRLLSLVGTVRPAVQADQFPKLEDHFQWKREPQLKDVIAHFKSVISTYVPQNKASYLVIVTEIYQYLSSKDYDLVNKVLSEAGIQRWIWNGDGFSSPAKVILKKASTDLSPYVNSLPSEMNPFSSLFRGCGVKMREDPGLLVTVLHELREKYEIQTATNGAEVKHDLQLSIVILNELKPSADKEMPREIHEQLLLPTDVENDFTLRLARIEDCTYCDTEWLKQGHDVYDAEDEDYVKLQYVHRNIPLSTAECLGVPSLMTRFLDPDQLGLGEEYGQSEPLTRRLHRLLEDYTDGFAVPKELIQNADDAGATEVKLLYDERTNEDARTCLIDEGMQECQGSALWAYNDAVFTDEDFENITKLSEGSKEMDSGKIGRFGLGFNAVYNLTDVPSFVSRNNIVILDPHTTHLGKVVRNKSKPGIKIDMMKNKKKLRKLRNQFKPYNGIFGCDLSPDAKQTFFNGTLFRFPLRNRSQADRSEIKKLFYDEKEMKKLLEIVIQGADSLLLFTQNVRKVTLFHLPREAKDPSEAVELFQIAKNPISTIRKHGVDVKLSAAAAALTNEEQSFLKECNFLKASSQVLQNIKLWPQVTEPLPESSMNIQVKCSFTKAGHTFFACSSTTGLTKCQAWLVSSSMGKNQSLKKAKGDKSLRPTAGVAVRLGEKSFTSFVQALNQSQVNDHVFCYLPLPIRSGLPVHINGGFAVTSNRRYLKERTEDDKDESGGVWNEVLLKDAVCKAYVNAMYDLRTMVDAHKATQPFYEVWPNVERAERLFRPLSQAFYNSLVNDSLELFTDGKRWASMEHALFLNTELRQVPVVGDVALKVFRQVSNGEDVVADLPFTVTKSLVDCGHGPVLSKRSYGVVKFYREIFFPHIQELGPEIRDILTLYALNSVKSKELDDILSQNQCIPVVSNGDKLKSPRELVHPTGDISSVFLPEDERFPHGSQQTYLSGQTLMKLEQLGMVKDEMDWDMMVERAQSVTILNSRDHEGAVKRTAELCRLMKRKLNCRHRFSTNTYEEEEKKRKKAQNSLFEIPFLPVLSQPENFPFCWQATEPETLVSAREAFPSSKQNLVSASAPIIQETVNRIHYFTYEVKDFLKLGDKKVLPSLVFSQLKQVMSVTPDIRNATKHKFISDVCTEIYKYLDEIYEEIPEQRKMFLKQEKVILTNDGFVSTNHVALDCPHDLSPYLYRLADTVARSFKKIGVRDKFEGRDYVSALCRMKDEFGEDPLEGHHLRLAVELVQQTGNCVVDSEEERAKLEVGKIYLPDSENILREMSDLCINDCLWIPEKSGVRYTNQRISPATCKTLGVKTRRIVSLSSSSKGIPFGQKEKLTNRVRGILEAYPCNKDILKELLQNADDAKATEICFIKDPRHHPDKFVLEESWKPLQGPALCVYNNKPFTRSDLEGIQNLGEGGKGCDPNKTGQYGVGFNSVYHLTDVPSFVSKGTEIGEVLCAFDPQCKYVPGATPEEPGRMYNVPQLEELYTDVFPCYKLGDRFPLEDAVMFRFPLRCEQKMAETSDISHSVVTIEDLDELMDDFKTELFEVLLFVNYIKEISLWEIDGTSGIPKERYRVKANLKPEEEKKRQEFGANTRNVTRQLKKEGKQLTDIQMKEVTYVMTLEGSCGHKEEWLVAQRLGFEDKVEVPQSVLTAYQRRELGLLPRGGAATLLSSTVRAVRRQMKAYCFLPLPLLTNLPVNINGHFALDHEARRNLWRDEGEGFRGDWNKFLLHDVVAACYVTLLEEVRNFLHLGSNKDHVTHLNCTRPDIQSRLERLRKLLPGVEVTVEDPYWATLTEAVYKYVDKHQVRILPVVRDLEANPNVSKPQKSGVSVYWLPPTGKDKDEAFFADLQDFPSPPSNSANDELKKAQSRQQMREAFQQVLLTTGFNLVEFPLSVLHAFLRSGIKASCISPSTVIDFYKSFRRKVPLCNIGQIPAQLSITRFKNDLSLMLVLQYCKRDPEFMTKLDGLPLLLTKDNQLSAFSRESPVFLSNFSDLLPECAGMFVHPTIYSTVSKSGSFPHVPEFKEFDVAAFASLLSNTLPKEKYHARNTFSHWSPNQKSVVPNQKWLQNVWRFLSAEVATMLRNKSKEKVKQDQTGGPNTPNIMHSKSKVDSGNTEKEKLSKVDEIQETRAFLIPLKEWSILPATETDKSAGKANTKTSQFLVPLKYATSVVDWSSEDSPSYYLRDAFPSLPELNWQVLQPLTFPDVDVRSRMLLRCFVATLHDPVTMLEAMNEKMSRSSLHGKLEQNEAKLILEYFGRNTEKLLQSEHIGVLKRLPLHETIHGNLIEITGRLVFVLPPGIPSHGIDIVEETSGVVFLKSQPALKRLHEFLGCKPSSAVDVYCDVVFRYFHNITENDRVAHLQYIQRTLLPILQIRKDAEDSEKLISSLSKLEFLPQPRSNCWGKASSFYDPDHHVFQVMLPRYLFPPKPFDTPDWLPFLRIIGLIKEVTSSKFVEFAKEVATEAQVLRNDSARRKSKILISHLFSRPNVIDDDYLLEEVSTIPFIASEHVDQALQSLHTQHGETTDGHLPYIAFKNAVAYEKKKLVWTTAHLLPPWANPQSYIHNCNSIIQHLKITEQPCLQQVMRHCRILCNKLVRENDMSEEFEEKRFQDKTSVMSKLYKFFQSNICCNDESVQVKRALQHTPCILVESGKRFVYPNQVVIEHFETQEIKPYLYAAPPEFGKFRNIFEQIGCPRTVGCNEYAMVLRLLQRLWPEEMVADPNNVKQILDAVKGYFESLEKGKLKGKSTKFESLYLPCYAKQRSNNSRIPQDEILPLHLRQGQTLIYDDTPRYKERLGQFSEMFLMDLKACGIKKVNLKDDLLIQIPKDHRPKFLSDVVKEELVAGEIGSAVSLGEASSLQQKLASQEFCRCVVRLIRHENPRNTTLVDGSIVQTIERKLRNIKFYGLEKVVTQLVYRGHVIPGSNEVVPHYQTQEIQGGEVIWNIYLSKHLVNSDETDFLLSHAITSAIREIANGQLVDSSGTIPTLLNIPIHGMWSLLDRLGIRQDDSYNPSLNSPLQEPGSFIPIKDHHLLDNKFQEFDVGDYVGFETCDDNLQEDEDATFIYAIIMEKIQESRGDIPSFAKKYKINIGRNREPVVVSAEKLYKFHRVLPVSPEGIVVFIDEEDESIAQKHKTKDEIFKEITRILEDAWRQPEDVRRRVVKRLYLRWHPDKNLGNEEFCKEVCHYIESEIARLSRPKYNPSYYGGCSTGLYGGLFACWRTRASRHRRCRDQYRVSFSQRYPRGTRSYLSTFSSCSYTRRYVPPSFSTSNPQPQEARRWLRQAEVDLEAVANDECSASVFYEWACFKCHQVKLYFCETAHCRYRCALTKRPSN